RSSPSTFFLPFLRTRTRCSPSTSSTSAATKHSIQHFFAPLRRKSHWNARRHLWTGTERAEAFRAETLWRAGWFRLSCSICNYHRKEVLEVHSEPARKALNWPLMEMVGLGKSDSFGKCGVELLERH